MDIQFFVWPDTPPVIMPAVTPMEGTPERVAYFEQRVLNLQEVALEDYNLAAIDLEEALKLQRLAGRLVSAYQELKRAKASLAKEPAPSGLSSTLMDILNK